MSGRGVIWRIVGIALAGFAGVAIAWPGPVTAQGAAKSGFLVISSSADPIKKGDILAAGQTVEVPAGKTVRLLDVEGKKVLTLNGPFSGAPAGGGDTGLLNRLGSALQQASADSISIGAFRSAPGTMAVVDPWVIDATASGDWCVAADKPVTLTRPKEGPAFARIALAALPTGPRIFLDWPASQHTLGWPARVPTTDTGAYQVELRGTGDAAMQTTSIVLHMMQSRVTDPMATALWMAESRCLRQAALLLSQIERGRTVRPLELSAGKREYRVGETMRLQLRSPEEAFVYCFYRDAAGEVTKFYPSPYERDARLAVGQHAIPAPDWKVPLTITDPPGKSDVTCFALDKDVSAHLPPEIGQPGFGVLARPLAGDLMRIFQSAPAGSLTTVGLSVTVIR